MNYAKNFRFTNILLRILSFIIYFFVANFIGKLATLLVSPVWTYAVKDNADWREILIYAVSVVFMLASISFFSTREGYYDTERMRFSYLRTIISYIFAAVIFAGLCYLTGILYYTDIFAEYFLMPYFPPYEIARYILNAPIIYTIAEYLSEAYIIIFCIVIIINTLMMIIFYAVGRHIWIRKQKSKIKNILREKYLEYDDMQQ